MKKKKWYENPDEISQALSITNGFDNLLKARAYAAKTDHEKLDPLHLFRGLVLLSEDGDYTLLMHGKLNKAVFIVGKFDNPKIFPECDDEFTLADIKPREFLEAVNTLSPVLCAGEKEFIEQFNTFSDPEKLIGCIFFDLNQNMINEAQKILSYNE